LIAGDPRGGAWMWRRSERLVAKRLLLPTPRGARGHNALPPPSSGALSQSGGGRRGWARGGSGRPRPLRQAVRSGCVAKLPSMGGARFGFPRGPLGPLRGSGQRGETERERDTLDEKQEPLRPVVPGMDVRCRGASCDAPLTRPFCRGSRPARPLLATSCLGGAVFVAGPIGQTVVCID